MEDWEKLLQLSSLRGSSPGDVFTNTAVISTKREERKFVINRFIANLVPRVPQLATPWSEGEEGESEMMRDPGNMVVHRSLFFSPR